MVRKVWRVARKRNLIACGQPSDLEVKATSEGCLERNLRRKLKA